MDSALTCPCVQPPTPKVTLPEYQRLRDPCQPALPFAGACVCLRICWDHRPPVPGDRSPAPISPEDRWKGPAGKPGTGLVRSHVTKVKDGNSPPSGCQRLLFWCQQQPPTLSLSLLNYTVLPPPRVTPCTPVTRGGGTTDFPGGA